MHINQLICNLQVCKLVSIEFTPSYDKKFSHLQMYVPYARHHKLLLIASRSWIQAIHKDRIFLKNLLKNKKMVFENGLKNIQAAAYNGARTVDRFEFKNYLMLY